MKQAKTIRTGQMSNIIKDKRLNRGQPSLELDLEGDKLDIKLSLQAPYQGFIYTVSVAVATDNITAFVGLSIAKGKEFILIVGNPDTCDDYELEDGFTMAFLLNEGNEGIKEELQAIYEGTL